MLEQYTLQTKDYLNFWIEDDSGGPPIFEFKGVKAVERALPGDKVVWNSDRTKLVFNQSVKHPPLSGVLELTSKYRYGLTNKGVPLYKFTPFNRAYPPFIVGSSEKDLSENRIGLINVESWSSTSSMPRGSLVRLFGPCGDYEAEQEGALWLITPWSTLKNPVIQEPAESEWTRRCSTPSNTFHIDPPGCKDIDDAISIEYDEEEDTYKIWITIADVAEWVPKGSELDEVALKLSQTTYRDGKAVRPMLPLALSEDSASLIPGQKRLGVSLIVEWDGEQIINTEWREVIVEVRDSYTYETVLAQLDKEWQDVLNDLTRYLSEDDSLEDGDSHKWIEECMVLYNTESAKYLKEAGCTEAIFRRHDEPDMESLLKYEKLGADVSILAQKSAEPCWSSEKNLRHFGLGRMAYCQASSPLRRYADLWNQRLIKHVIHGFSFGEMSRNSQLLKWMKSREKSIKAYDRNQQFLKAIFSDVVDSNIIEAQVLGAKALEGDQREFIKVKFWVPSWKKLITWKTYGFVSEASNTITLIEILFGGMRQCSPGDTLRLRIYANFQSASWKDRILFQLAV